MCCGPRRGADAPARAGPMAKGPLAVISWDGRGVLEPRPRPGVLPSPRPRPEPLPRPREGVEVDGTEEEVLSYITINNTDFILSNW